MGAVPSNVMGTAALWCNYGGFFITAVLTEGHNF